MKRNRSQIVIGFPFWKYLKQAIICPTASTIWNPVNFWRSYQIQHLDSCWEIDVVARLERCWIKADRMEIQGYS